MSDQQGHSVEGAGVSGMLPFGATSDGCADYVLKSGTARRLRGWKHVGSGTVKRIMKSFMFSGVRDILQTPPGYGFTRPVLSTG